MKEEEILELVKNESTSTKGLEEIIANHPEFPHGIDEEIVECLSCHPNSSANILDKIFNDDHFRSEVTYELASHPNASIKALESLQYDVDEYVAELAQEQLKKRGVKAKIHPLRGKTIYVVMHSHSDGCVTHCYADSDQADNAEHRLKRKLGDDPGYVWQEVQEIK